MRILMMEAASKQFNLFKAGQPLPPAPKSSSPLPAHILHQLVTFLQMLVLHLAMVPSSYSRLWITISK